MYNVPVIVIIIKFTIWIALCKVFFNVFFSFVSPKWVPQMADHSDVYSKITKVHGVSYPVLVPNMRGLLTAVSLKK